MDIVEMHLRVPGTTNLQRLRQLGEEMGLVFRYRDGVIVGIPHSEAYPHCPTCGESRDGGETCSDGFHIQGQQQ